MRKPIEFKAVKQNHDYDVREYKLIVDSNVPIFGRSVSEYFILSYLEDHFEPYHTPEIRLHVLYPFTVEEMHS